MITPQENHPELAKAIGLPNVVFKREDLHPYGSHKGRSIPVMINHYLDKGMKNFVISSSGNAAFAAAKYISELNGKYKSGIELDIFVGNKITDSKLSRLQQFVSESIRVLKKERPLQAVTQAINEGKCSLRQSTNDIALIGYESLADEILEIKNIDAVFIGTSSGTTAQSIASYLIRNNCPLQIHIVQTTSCHAIADEFEAYDGPEETSIADAIVDQTAYRKSVLIPLIKQLGGKAWVAKNEDIKAAEELVRKHSGLDISPNSALSVVGAMQAAYVGYPVNQGALCLICGE